MGFNSGFKGLRKGNTPNPLFEHDDDELCVCVCVCVCLLWPKFIIRQKE